MNSSTSQVDLPDSPINRDAVDVGLAELLHDDFKYKHAAFWNIFYRLSFIISAILVFPFATTISVQIKPQALLFFPFFSLLVTLFGVWIMLGEQARLQRAAEKAFTAMDTLISKSVLSQTVNDYDEYKASLNRLARTKVAKLMTFAILFSGIVLSLVEASIFLFPDVLLNLEDTSTEV